ncbi:MULTISPECIES: pyruvate, phosphate dikinase [unclassified Romboutsia]|uniref:pyruvate, phosphate dikinase n=1 Tax=unclassified Romboutsia TaxID=2626894 RepID=UPI001899C238|nr:MULTISPECIES: pyruvate, phosphate dikinase [unclassified Romboutsia]MDB8803970.1 pyruvate, phosphate dikinase [Romboutsia sp. 1001216sp1]MDB8806680.1 pyruvate, phosphate dikinase [Romboutsia sp. 1001216sp1]MDB8809616.1 pyruvate, phosphate dikinase [Romboutsia sp. 1001216sp1]MDB8815366.1 pyruvate, phosphate dikinase [Romboutsia sp. 1001216sp1]MDB8818058.1 pyruvate, phosphate dikinase [Romboutsia sp. 1001216sp1]
MEAKYVYSFEEGNKDMRYVLGGKGANLAEMTNIGLPVPQGFTISTDACNDYYKNNETISDNIINEIEEKLKELQEKQGKTLGGEINPLLLSVRSGAVFSMPGMMDTILNLGLNDTSVVALANSTQNERFAYDSYRRFIQMFSDVAMGIPKYKFENALDKIKEAKGYTLDTELNVEDLKELVKKYKEIYTKEIKSQFPQDPKEQLMLAIKAVFKSWNNPRAIVYRKLNDIPSDLGTAVNIQSMVFGNMGETSGTGVAFTRNPSTGENKIFGEFLMNAQGEDVVAGIRTPKDISSLKEVMPKAYDEFMKITSILENHYKDMQDIEFTIENEKLYILQTRSGKRTAGASINIAVDLVGEGIINEKEAIMRIEPKQLDQLLHPRFESKSLNEAIVIAKGLPASPGAACGKVYFNAEDVVDAKNRGEESILVRLETSPEDIEGMVCAEGILTARGGMTSHAAVVARGMGKCCVAGCSDIKVDEYNKEIRTEDVVIKEGEYISLDGSSGCVYIGKVEKTEVSLTGNFEKLMNWANKYKSLMVRTNADNPRDAKAAIKFGAEGIGLCRTEHMFFDEDRIPAVREMILSKTLEQRLVALERLLPMQQKDFVDIFRVMDGKSVNIRLLDPPLHEFLPHDDETIKSLSESMKVSVSEIKRRIVDLDEFNPMLGHRGCRLAITFPEIYIMQAKAIINGAIEATKEGIKVMPEIMIPLVGEAKELKVIKEDIKETIDNILEKENMKIDYTIGTMIEVPRACLTADEIAKEADFFSFGTNDLTQMTFGYSRDDAGKFLGEYVNRELLEKDPFEVLDQRGVGKLIELGAKLGKSVKPNIKLGICGEHGGEPSSIEFCYKAGLDYVSCSPYRVPIARLSAAQAVIKNEK